MPRSVYLLPLLFWPAQASTSDPSWILEPRILHQKNPGRFVEHGAANPNPSAAYRWLDVILEASARRVDRVGARPSIISREMAIAVTALYDAWAAYDEKAVGTRLGSGLRRPPKERTLANKEKAIAYAVFRSLLYVFPEDAEWVQDQMRKAGYAPEDRSTDVSTPQGVGNTAAQAVIDYRRRDGSNQDGDEAGSDGRAYSDYTFYEPRNSPSQIVDPDRWQPIPFSDGKGGKFWPGFLTPHWYRVKPFAFSRSDRFRPGTFPKIGSEELKKEVDEVLYYNGHLTLPQKAIVEFMRDGPRSTGQSGHWLRFAQDLSRRDHYDLDRDVKLFFTVGNTVFDAFIACWEAKRYYDSSRPWTLIRWIYRGKTIRGYLGPWKGYAQIPAEDWRPYSPDTFVTPPFPGYPSGHSTASGAGSKILELFTGSDRFQVVTHRKAGILTEADCDTCLMQAVQGVPPKQSESPEVALYLPTFTATAELAGISRVMGGYHIQADNVAGLSLGRKIAEFSWPLYQAYFDGTSDRLQTSEKRAR